MYKAKITKFLLNLTIVTLIFLVDRISKIYILNKVDLQNVVDIYLNPYLNFYLIWNQGVAFGLFSFEGNFLYNLITLTIIMIIFIIFMLIINAKGFKRYSLLLVLGGALGNLFDRIYYKAVPDFIDLHINNFHWFVFNVADIFITIGIMCLISAEIFFKDN